MTTRESHAKERALQRKKKKLVTYFSIFVVLIVIALIILGFVLNKVTPETILADVTTTENLSTTEDDCYQTMVAQSTLLKDAIFKDETLENTIRNELGNSFNSSFTVFLSISDGQNSAGVVHGSASSLEGAYHAAEEKLGELVRKNLISSVYLRADLVNSIKRISSSSLASEISSETGGIYGEFFRKGIAFDGAFHTAVLENELNAAELIDYDIEKNLLFDKLNLYLESKGLSKLDSMPSDLYLFSCRGYIAERSGCYTLSSKTDSSYGRRIVETVDRNYVNARMSAAAEYVLNGMDDYGKFTYGEYPLQGLPIESYDIGAHAAMITALLRYSEISDNAGFNDSLIQSSVQYLLDQIVEKDSVTAFAADKTSGKLTAGGTANAILALCQYEEKHPSAEIESTLARLGNGLLSMIDSGTSKLNHELFYHSDGAEDFTVRTIQIDRSYDSLAVYALAKLYSTVKDQRYLEAAKKLMNILIQENYVQYCDANISLAIEELTKYENNPEYYNFALRNFNDNIANIESRITSNPAYTRLLLSTYRIYARMQAQNVTTDLFTSFNHDRLALAAVSRAEDLLNGIAFPETAIYFRSPEKYFNAFFVRQDGFRIRIDTEAAFIEAYADYSESYTTVSADAFTIQSRKG